MTDHLTMSRRHRDKSNLDLAWFKRNRMTVGFVSFGAALGLAGLVALSTMNAGPFPLAEGDDVASITGIGPALDIGEEWNRPVRLLSNGRYYPADYKIARLLANDTKEVGIIVIVPPGAVVEKKNWHWHYRPPVN